MMEAALERSRGAGMESVMSAIIASQLLSFILGGSLFLLRHDRGHFTITRW
jgi:hypothetical protein